MYRSVWLASSARAAAATDQGLAFVAVVAAHISFLLLVSSLAIAEATLLVGFHLVIVVVRFAVVDRKDDLVLWDLLATRKVGLACSRGRDVVPWRSGAGIGLREAWPGCLEVVFRVSCA